MKKPTLKNALLPRMAVISSLLGLSLLCDASTAFAQQFVSHCDQANGVNDLHLMPDNPPHTGVVTFGGQGSWGWNATKSMVCTGSDSGAHAGAQAPLVGPRNSSDYWNTFTFAIKFPSTSNATHLNQIFFQIFEMYGPGWNMAYSYNYNQPIVMAVRETSGSVRLIAVHQSKINDNVTSSAVPNDADNDSVIIGTAPMDTWMRVKIKVRVGLQSSNSFLSGKIVADAAGIPADGDLSAVALNHGGLIYRRPNQTNQSGVSQYNPDLCFPWVGNYTWAESGFTQSFVGTTNIDEYTQLNAAWGYQS